MLTASTEGQLSRIIKKLSQSMSCGKREQVLLKNYSLLSFAARSVVSESLSLIDAYEESRGIIITIENRFGKKCRE
ncbi:MAG: hypothetical protein J7J11_01160 [Desulfurococcales archaeon]|nr:hypothetical protein [Desulfurococcales archaeon]